ncbi:MAG: 3-oxoacyl-[acyl-carrier-protein] synthase-3 [Cyclobacteriaceae bacterium]|jgi:3-oxoacyl-[acyl-carrier-protein] synthase-3
MVGIKAISTFFSDSYLDVGEIQGRDVLSKEEREYFDGLGIDKICLAEGYSSYDIAKEACTQLLLENQIDSKSIDLIIYIQERLPEYFISSSAARLQFDLNAVNAVSFSIGDLGCTDMTMAIKLAKDQLVLNPAMKNVLICYGHKQYAASRFRYPVTINGDGGIAILVGRTNDNCIVDLEIKMNGKFWDLFQVDYFDKSFEDYVESCTNHRSYGFELPIITKMNLVDINVAVLKRNNLTFEDVDHFFLQNLSKRAYNYTESSLDIKLSDSCEENLRQYGHLGPLDVILNYKTAIESGKIKKGEKALIMNNSPVAAWSSILIQA